MTSRLVCAGCGAEAGRFDPYPFRCRERERLPDIDHVLRRVLDLSRVEFPLDDPEPNPFLRYRRLSHAWQLGLADGEFCAIVRELDARLEEVDGQGFRATPFFRSDRLSNALGFSDRGGVWVKDETGGVSGSHKARHLFGVLVYLEVAERLGIALGGRELAVASCGNAALAAAVVAAAGSRALRVFVPREAEPAVLARLERLGARIAVCPRTQGVEGDPTVRALLLALEEGALPFTCQGSLNGLAIEGGQTLGYELAAATVVLDRVVVQVGGGALASACIHALDEAVALGVLASPPRVDTVQTEGAWPLKRAYDRVLDRGLAYATTHRSEFMWPWETTPRSVAHGILDDETYDWLAVVEGMLATGGTPVVVAEETLERANRLAVQSTGIAVDHTGSAGLAGLIALREADAVRDDERVAVLFTGVVRSRRETDDEELSRTGHPVPQGLRAR